MIKTKLSPCESLLYHWILFHTKTNQKVNLNWHNFQAWTAEFLEHSVSLSEVHTALTELQRLKLITVQGTEVAPNNIPNIPPLELSPLPQKLLTTNRKFKLFSWGSVMSLIFLVVWLGSGAMYFKLYSGDSNHYTNPYQFLGEKIK
ncbi:MAG: hypothetical protein RID09_18790 [Coleofasciculus sp. G1-WW12-02]|uniref:hypothetical protein n=1 Tax=Coleofasciculus sp. G1-WW12-02 TaxID=3068483 RepID=UPI003300A9F2